MGLQEEPHTAFSRVNDKRASPRTINTLSECYNTQTKTHKYSCVCANVMLKKHYLQGRKLVHCPKKTTIQRLIPPQHNQRRQKHIET